MMNSVRKFLPVYVFFISLFIFTGNGICQTSPVGNSIIIIIHGDNDYLFHSNDGESLQADEIVLNKAIAAAEKILNSEVFIFHQKKKEYSFLFFPSNDLDFYYFRDGVLKEKTSAQRTNFDFMEEFNFYKKHAAKGLQNILLYYGHEIPLSEGYGYNSSYNNQPFNLNVFNNAVNNFAGGKKLDLVVLSTCNNGSPEVIAKLASSARYIIASPENLHLSYMNPGYLKKLNYYRENNFDGFVVDFAESSFNELKRHVETVITISGYKTDELSNIFMKSAKENNGRNNSLAIENCDCGEFQNFNSEEVSRGVIVFYNPPKFGKDKFKTEHSGWGCKRERNFSSTSFSGDSKELLQSSLLREKEK